MAAILRGDIDSSGRPLTTAPTGAPAKRPQRAELRRIHLQHARLGKAARSNRTANSEPNSIRVRVALADAARQQRPGEDAGAGAELEDRAVERLDLLRHQPGQRFAGGRDRRRPAAGR